MANRFGEAKYRSSSGGRQPWWGAALLTTGHTAFALGVPVLCGRLIAIRDWLRGTGGGPAMLFIHTSGTRKGAVGVAESMATADLTPV